MTLFAEQFSHDKVQHQEQKVNPSLNGTDRERGTENILRLRQASNHVLPLCFLQKELEDNELPPEIK